MNSIKRYCKKIKKETEKILCRLFGKKSIAHYIGLKYKLKTEIECAIGRNVDTIKDEEIKKLHLGYQYSMYKTLDKVLRIYTDSSILEIVQDMED